MLLSLLYLAGTLSCYTAASIPRPKNVTVGLGYISLPVIAVNNTGGSIHKRQNDVDIFNTDLGTVYLVHLALGTPPQPVYLLLDTGSSETWVDPDCTKVSSAHQKAECNGFPKYDPYSSSTAYDVGYRFDLAYGKGTASGEYLLDTFYVVQWADTTTSAFAGIIATGFGYEIAGYYGLVDEMYVQGIINSRAFSSILFGGIDTKKFTGSLEKRPIIAPSRSPDGELRYWIYMTSVGITKPGATTSKRYTVAPPAYQQPVFLDSGGTLSALPSNLVAAMLSDFTGVVDIGSGLYLVDCIQTTQSGTLDFGFGNTIIKVPYNEWIWESCYSESIAHLWTRILTIPIAVFDQDNGNLLLAQYQDCGSNIIPIGSGVNAVPSVTGACRPTRTAASITSKSSTRPSKSPSTGSPKVTVSSSKAASSSVKSSSSKKPSSLSSSKGPSSTKPRSTQPAKSTASSASKKSSLSPSKSGPGSKLSTASTTAKPTTLSSSKSSSASKKRTSTQKP
ncbi:unnamed protein product [Diplocarpon coronariae]